MMARSDIHTKRASVATPKGQCRSTSSQRMRLDDVLVERGFADNRAAALRIIIAGEVKVDMQVAKSAAMRIAPGSALEVKSHNRFVSRGGEKLQAALEAFDQQVEGLCCIDIGSSTGGFSDCLLQAGARAVTCVDVNYSQLAWSVRTDARVTVFERTNIRQADPAVLGAPFDLIVADLSFIGLARLARVFARLGQEGSVFIGLVKPQFESKQGEADGGVVTDEAVRLRTVHEVEDALATAGFTVTGVIESPITGKRSGNVEYLVRAVLK